MFISIETRGTHSYCLYHNQEQGEMFDNKKNEPDPDITLCLWWADTIIEIPGKVCSESFRNNLTADEKFPMRPFFVVMSSASWGPLNSTQLSLDAINMEFEIDDTTTLHSCEQIIEERPVTTIK